MLTSGDIHKMNIVAVATLLDDRTQRVTAILKAGMDGRSVSVRDLKQAVEYTSEMKLAFDELDNRVRDTRDNLNLLVEHTEAMARLLISGGL